MSILTPTLTSLKTLSTTPKTILITGSSSGIGHATTVLLSTLNPSHNLILVDLTPPPSSLTHAASNVLHCTCDITSWTAQRAAFAQGKAKFGRIDYVFANAGISEDGDQFFAEKVDGEGELAGPGGKTLGVDLEGLVMTVKLAIYYLRRNDDDAGGEGGGRRGRGGIVLTASLAGYLGTAGMHMYSAAKHGVVGLMRALKHECRALGIAVSVVAPAVTATPLILATDGSTVKRVEGNGEGMVDEHARVLRKGGVTVNRVESVALAVCWLWEQGLAASGMGVLVQNDRFVDLERGLMKNRDVWMGREALEDFQGGKRSEAFGGEQKGGKAKI
ncbi:NAD(P)-binding protein [Periconia macrospinosa]|uniref:NAD(P)-binding protein n=1 Tax=Periconia macrospinosa TaxID=97972 RepID=A0A2V1DN10_9PLEO|nr:NAD(P)-binding protein [Periconia macrospinosa]